MKKLQHAVDQLTTGVSAVMCVAMMVILMANVVLRLIPGIGGFSWYMEASQYLNVWSMLIAGIGISVTRTHLKVAVADDLTMKIHPIAHKIQQGFVALSIIVFYLVMAYSGYTYAMRSNQVISTMPSLKMSMVYWMFPITGVLGAFATALDYVIFLTEKKEGAEK